MATTTTNVLNALRYTYGVNKVQYLFNQESPTWAILSKVKKGIDRKSTRLNSSHIQKSRMPSSA